MSDAVDPGWRRNQRVMVATVFVVFMGFAFVLPFLPLYVRELGVADDATAALWAGVLIGTAPLVAGLVAPIWGRLADRHGQKPIALLALGAYVVFLALSATARTPLELLGLRMGIGLFGGIGPLALAMASAGAPKERTGQAVGSVQAAQILAAAVGPLIGGTLADAVGMRQSFFVTTAICAVAWALVLLGFHEPGGERSAADAPAKKGSIRDVLRLPEVAVVGVVLFFVNFIGRSFTPILPLQLEQLGVDARHLALHTGALISAYAVAAATSALLAGKLARARSPRAMLIASLAAGGITVLPIAYVTSFAQFVAIGVAFGLASGGSLTLCYTLGSRSAPEHSRATAFGVLASAALFGGAVSPSVAGFLARWDLRGIYYLDAALYAALVVFALAFVPRARIKRGTP